eukprot:TRINITY_DN3382_c0_g1_i3.p1 TRINITY_DN3382_c0_g1~~TRINITY_DN3382_c0_g1_i3.p1  ORF type:complete len:467 (+),score=84.17 TRINITY_DN3382_c0_g1_i3:103-1503(+)
MGSDTTAPLNDDHGKRLRICLYGEVHDITDFAPKHPGGEKLLREVANYDLPDATPLFESYHALKDPEAMRKMLKAYATGEKVQQLYSFEEGDFYRTVRSRVTAKIKEMGLGRKAIGGTLAIVKSAVCAAVWAGLLVLVVVLAAKDVGPLAMMAAAFLAGVMLMQVGLVTMHDSSHYALAVCPRLNETLSTAWNTVAYWDSALWFSHHVLFHHSYTMDNMRDPDMHHGSPLMRKHTEAPLYATEHLMVGHPLVQLFAMMVLPGMYIGSILQYNFVLLLPEEHKWLWTLDFRNKILARKWWQHVLATWAPLWVITITYYRSFFTAIMLGVVYGMGANVCYSGNILADHDAIETHIATKDKTVEKADSLRDWGEVQARGSGNWAGAIWCFLFGGINYQIEHHLFPCVYHRYYPEIAPVVRQTCEEFKIPYVHFDTITEAISSVYSQLLTVHKQIQKEEQQQAEASKGAK